MYGNGVKIPPGNIGICKQVANHLIAPSEVYDVTGVFNGCRTGRNIKAAACVFLFISLKTRLSVFLSVLLQISTQPVTFG